jgi:hypothetical protein
MSGSPQFRSHHAGTRPPRSLGIPGRFARGRPRQRAFAPAQPAAQAGSPAAGREAAGEAPASGHRDLGCVGLGSRHRRHRGRSGPRAAGSSSAPRARRQNPGAHRPSPGTNTGARRGATDGSRRRTLGAAQ